MSNGAIVFSDDDDKSWCDRYGCGGELIELKDGSMICQTCEYVYGPDATTKHKSKMSPEIDRSITGDGPELVTITDYASPRKKAPTPGEIEDRIFASKKSGLSITSAEEWLPEPAAEGDR